MCWIAFVVLVGFQPGASAHPASAVPVFCGGVAPAVTDCSTGTHPADPPVGHGAFGPPGYVGTLVTRIDFSPAGFHELTCDFSGSAAPDCTDSFEDPGPSPASYTHTCHSYDLGTTTPGGVGAWICATSHGGFGP